MRRRRREFHEPAPDPTRRPNLLRHALEFILGAREVRGVLRIAMLGSILTDKPCPKDIDLLLTIADDADIETLAPLARRLQGRGQSLASGADLFLADATHRYVGRVCHYRECWPRRACRARHCGLRGHICDDLDIVDLSTALVSEPPLELWPRLVERITPPADVRELLIRPFCRQSRSS